MTGRFPLNRDLALELASLMAQIEFGDIKTTDVSLNQQTTQVLDRFYPKKYKDSSEDGLRFVVCSDCGNNVVLKFNAMSCVSVYIKRSL